MNPSSPPTRRGFSQSLPESRGCDDSLGMQHHTRDSCVLEVFPRQVAAKLSLSQPGSRCDAGYWET